MINKAKIKKRLVQISGHIFLGLFSWWQVYCCMSRYCVIMLCSMFVLCFVAQGLALLVQVLSPAWRVVVLVLLFGIPIRCIPYVQACTRVVYIAVDTRT